MKSKIAVIGHLFTAYVDYRDDYQPKGAKRLESLAKILNQNGVDTVILAGDYVHTATEDNYRYLKRHFVDILHSDCIGLRSSHEVKGHASGEIEQTTLCQVSDFYVPGSHPNIIMITQWGWGRKHNAKPGKDIVITKQQLTKINEFLKTTAQAHKICILPDLRYKDSPHCEQLESLLENFDLIVIGDNESSMHNYGWYYLNNSKARVIMTGFAYGLKYQLGGIGTYVVLTLDRSKIMNVSVVPFMERWDSRIYEINPKKIRISWLNMTIKSRILKALTWLPRAVSKDE